MLQVHLKNYQFLKVNAVTELLLAQKIVKMYFVLNTKTKQSSIFVKVVTPLFAQSACFLITMDILFHSSKKLQLSLNLTFMTSINL